MNVFLFHKGPAISIRGWGAGSRKNRDLETYDSLTEFHPINYRVKCPIGKGLNE